jgi:transcriptional regulator with XRE-family HTH domain
MQTMAQRITKMREKRGLSPSALAKAAQIPLSTLSVVERGLRRGEGLTVETAKRLATALGVSLDYLAGMYDEVEDEQTREPATVPPAPPKSPRQVRKATGGTGQAAPSAVKRARARTVASRVAY